MVAPNADIPRTVRAEFMDWVVFLMVESGMMRAQMGATISFGDRIDAPRLERSLRLLMDAEPILGCRFATEGDPPHWERMDDLDACVRVPVRYSDDPATDAARFIATDMDIRGGPQVFAQILRHRDRDVLAVRVNHAAIDGGAMKQTLYALSGVYRTLGAEPDWLPEPDLHPRDLSAISRMATLGERLRAMRVRKHFPRTEWSVPGLVGSGRPAYVGDTVEPAGFTRLVAWGRSRGATVHDVLLTAYYRALYAALAPAEGSHTPVNMSADLRPWLPSGVRMAPANLPTTWAIDVPPRGGESFDGTLERVMRRTREFRSADVGRLRAVEAQVGDRLVRLAGFEAMRRRWSSISRTLEGTGYPSLTNLGIIDAEALDFGEALPVSDAVLYGPIGHPGGFILTVSTFRDTFRLIAGIDRGAMDEHLARRIVQDTAAGLRTLTGG